VPAPSPTRLTLGFWAIAFAFLVEMAVSAVPTPLYAIYAQRDGFASFTVTVIFAAYAVGVVASLFLAGHLSDWYGRRRVLVPALVLQIVSAAIFLLWRDVTGLIVARFLGGLSVGAVTATATAWITELDAARRGRSGPPSRTAQVVATAANLGGIGVGPLVAGALAEWVAHPLTVPYVVFAVLLALAAAIAAVTPETREPLHPAPRYRPQRAAVPGDARRPYLGAATGAGIAFATFGLFTSLAPTFLAGTLGHGSRALAGVTAFAVFAAAAAAQAVLADPPLRTLVAGALGAMTAGLALLVLAVWLPSPSLALFIAGGVVCGAGAGALFKGCVATVVGVAEPARRAEALAGLFLAGYIGLSIPVLGLGVLTQEVSARTALLVFAAVAVAANALAGPAMLSSAGRRP
jgi:MFS family permease